jgi:hypothetical protein
MEKPEKYTVEYYDWHDAWDYIKEKYNPDQKIIVNEQDYDPWQYLVDFYEVSNGKIITITDWDLVYNNGQFAHLVPPAWAKIVNLLMDEFGEFESNNISRKAKFETSW